MTQIPALQLLAYLWTLPQNNSCYYYLWSPYYVLSIMLNILFTLNPLILATLWSGRESPSITHEAVEQSGKEIEYTVKLHRFKSGSATYSLYHPGLTSWIFLKMIFILFLDTGVGREKERERNIKVWLSLTGPLLGTWPTTQACALTGNWTRDPLFCRLVLNPLSHTSQGSWIGFDDSRSWLMESTHSLIIATLWIVNWLHRVGTVEVGRDPTALCDPDLREHC